MAVSHERHLAMIFRHPRPGDDERLGDSMTVGDTQIPILKAPGGGYIYDLSTAIEPGSSILVPNDKHSQIFPWSKDSLKNGMKIPPEAVRRDIEMAGRFPSMIAIGDFMEMIDAPPSDFLDSGSWEAWKHHAQQFPGQLRIRLRGNHDDPWETFAHHQEDPIAIDEELRSVFPIYGDIFVWQQGKKMIYAAHGDNLAVRDPGKKQSPLKIQEQINRLPAPLMKLFGRLMKLGVYMGDWVYPVLYQGNRIRANEYRALLQQFPKTAEEPLSPFEQRLRVWQDRLNQERGQKGEMPVSLSLRDGGTICIVHGHDHGRHRQVEMDMPDTPFTKRQILLDDIGFDTPRTSYEAIISTATGMVYVNPIDRRYQMPIFRLSSSS